MEKSLRAQDLHNRGTRHASPPVFISVQVDYLLTPSRKMPVLSKSMTLWQRHVMSVPFCGYFLFCKYEQQLREQEEHKSISKLSREE